VPDGSDVVIDLSSTIFVDLDNIDIINGFIKGAPYRGITVQVRGDASGVSAGRINAPEIRLTQPAPDVQAVGRREARA
jgi:carbonic anhydrase